MFLLSPDYKSGCFHPRCGNTPTLRHPEFQSAAKRRIQTNAIFPQAGEARERTIPSKPEDTAMKKNDLILVIMSLISIVFVTIHFASDVLRAHAGNPEGGGSTLVAVPIVVVWLYGTLMLAGRRSGNIIMLIGAVIAFGMPIIHVNGPSGFFTGQLARSTPGDFIFVWTLHVLAVTGLFSFVLAVQALVSGTRKTS